MSRRAIILSLSATLLVALLLLADAALACPTCKDNMAADPDSANLVRGYFWSILFMMSMPFLILAGLSSYFYWEIRKARAQQRAMIEAGLKSSGG